LLKGLNKLNKQMVNGKTVGFEYCNKSLG